MTTALRVSLTNVLGLGATELAKSLMPALDAVPGLRLDTVYVPQAGVANALAAQLSARTVVYRRRLPKAVSRIIECTLLGRQFDGNIPLLVMGDIPIATSAPQIVFVQNPHLVRRSETSGVMDSLRYRVSRALFRRNCRYARAFVVQSEAMRSDLLAAYPLGRENVHVIAQPPPSWLLSSNINRLRPRSEIAGLRLFYPAAAYPHKNHELLSLMRPDVSAIIDRLVLTIDSSTITAPPSWVRCKGRLESADVIAEYCAADALLFLSKAESFGFPLVEAMWIGLPVVCPDLPYARVLCGDQAIYFDSDSPASLQQALSSLHTRLAGAWWPDWRNQLAKLPADWASVATELAKLAARIS